MDVLYADEPLEVYSFGATNIDVEVQGAVLCKGREVASVRSCSCVEEDPCFRGGGRRGESALWRSFVFYLFSVFLLGCFWRGTDRFVNLYGDLHVG